MTKVNAWRIVDGMPAAVGGDARCLDRRELGRGADAPPTPCWRLLRSTRRPARRDAGVEGVGMDVTQPYRGRAWICFAASRSCGAARWPAQSTHASRSNEDDTVAGNEHPQRALLWVDAVGGFLVCLDDCVDARPTVARRHDRRADPGRFVAAPRRDPPRRRRLRARAAAANARRRPRNYDGRSCSPTII